MGALVAINGSFLAAVFFLHTALDRFRLAAAHRILLVAAHDVGLVATHRGFLIGLDIGDLSIEVFLFRTFHIHGTVAGHSIGLVASYIVSFVAPHFGIQVGFVIFRHVADYGLGQGAFHRTGFIAADRGGQVFTDRIGHVFRSGVHQVFGGIRDSAVFGLIGDILSGLFRRSGIGPVGYRAGDAAQLLFHGGEFRAGRVLDFLEERVYSLAEGGSIAICIRHDIAGFRCRLEGHVGLVPVLYGIGHGVLVVRNLAHSGFCIRRRVIASIRKFLADAVGSNRALADGIIVLRPSVAAVFVESRCTGLCFARYCIQFQIHGLRLAAIDGGVVVCIHRTGKSLRIKGSVDGKVFVYGQVSPNRSVARSFQRSRFHSAGGLDGSGSYLQSGAGDLAAADSPSPNIQALAGNVPSHCQIATYGSTMIDLQCIGGCIAGIGQTIGREGPAYRCIAGSGQGTESAGSAGDGGACNSAAVDVSALGIQAGTGNGFTRNISCRNDIMGIDVAGCSQISILERSYTVCQFISGDGTAACIDITAVGTECPSLGVDISAAGLDYTAIGLDGTTLGCHVASGIHGEFAIGAFDAAVRVEGGLGRRGSIAAGIESVGVLDGAVQAYFDALIVQGNLVVIALVQDHFLGIGLGDGHIALVINGSGVLLQNIVVAQAQSAVDDIHQFPIGCFTGCSFVVDIGLQGRICCFTGCCFKIDICLELFICFFQVGHRVLPFAGFFVNRFLQVGICCIYFSLSICISDAISCQSRCLIRFFDNF